MTIRQAYDVEVVVQTYYEQEQSNPTAPYFFFSYLIHIKNRSAHAVQLLSRHWDIYDPGSGEQTVEGEGVVGKQPVIAPGEFHEYRSFCQLRSPFGKMDGFYTFEDPKTGVTFQVKVPTLIFQYPTALN